ncbi:MAG: hypothetical protein C0595_09675 [Marinilabiliales bacterium]|nr:MAG: hypothetical protein C0595_09675 [Marinilabiliales bacterium]
MKNIDKPKVLLSGACSYVGEELLSYLVQNTDMQIIACCRNFHEQKTISSGVIYEEADLLDLRSYENIFEKYKPKYVFHLAAVTRLFSGEDNPELTVKANYFGTKNIADLCEKYNSKIFISASSNLAREPKSVVGLTKYLSEVYLRNKSKSCRMISVRLANVVDSKNSVSLFFKKQIADGGPVTVTDARMERRFIDKKQAVYYLMKAFENGKNKDVYVITKENTNITNLAQEMINESGKNIDIEFVGSKKGEKLIEESYHIDEIVNTEIQDFAILKNDWQPQKIERAINLLQNKSENTEFKFLMKKLKLSLQSD